MVSKRTGRPRGRPKLDFFKDPDRYRLAFIEASMEVYGLTFEPAALLTLGVMDGKPVPSGKQKLSRSREKLLKRGWKLQTFQRAKHPQKMDSQIDTLRRKRKQFADNAKAQLWLHNMCSAWVNLFRQDRVGPAAALLIFKCAETAGERGYA